MQGFENTPKQTNVDPIRKMFKKLTKISCHPVGLESGKCVCILKPCGFHPRENRSLNRILESNEMTEINERANYHLPAGKTTV